MPKDKDLKRLVRARMEKTGESYTAARAHLVSRNTPLLPEDYESLAGMSDDAVRKATGMAWREWARALDAAGAAAMQHREIADHVHESYDVSGWWSQMVTVAYERFRGLRDKGQRRGGGYDVNKSRTFGVAVEALWQAVHDAATRARWLPDTDLTVTTATEPKSMRIRLSDDTRLDAYFTARSEVKSVLSIQHRGLPDREAAEAMKAYWGERLSALAELLRER